MLNKILKEILIEAHEKAVEKGLDEDFAGILEVELSKKDRSYSNRIIKGFSTGFKSVDTVKIEIISK